MKAQQPRTVRLRYTAKHDHLHRIRGALVQLQAQVTQICSQQEMSDEKCSDLCPCIYPEPGRK